MQISKVWVNIPKNSFFIERVPGKKPCQKNIPVGYSLYYNSAVSSESEDSSKILSDEEAVKILKEFVLDKLKQKARFLCNDIKTLQVMEDVVIENPRRPKY